MPRGGTRKGVNDLFHNEAHLVALNSQHGLLVHVEQIMLRVESDQMCLVVHLGVPNSGQRGEATW
eukprot:615698-Prorocentrum_minimum.AAC.1